MKLNVPSHDQYGSVSFEVSWPGDGVRVNCDTTLDEVEVNLPEDVDDRDVEIAGYFRDAVGRQAGDVFVVKEAEVRESDEEQDETEPEEVNDEEVADQVGEERGEGAVEEVGDEPVAEEVRESPSDRVWCARDP